MERKQFIGIVKGVAIGIAAIGIIMVLKQNLVASIMIIIGTAAFYFAERN